MTAELPDVASGSHVQRFWSGARVVASGIAWSLREPALRRLVVVPMLVQAALFVAAVVGGAGFVDDVARRIAPDPGHWYSFLAVVVDVALWIVLFAVAAIAAVVVGSVICDPIYDTLSERAEALAGGQPDTPTQRSWRAAFVGVAAEAGRGVVRVAVYVAGVVPLWLLGLTGVGSIVALPLGVLWTWLFVALEALARPLARARDAGGQGFSSLRGHGGAVLGLGAAGWLVSFVPFTMPLLVVSGALWHAALVRRSASGALVRPALDARADQS